MKKQKTSIGKRRIGEETEGEAAKKNPSPESDN
jgi:hypothetical protein